MQLVKLETFVYQTVKEWCILRFTMKYVIAAHSHSPYDLFSSLFTKRFDKIVPRGQRYPNSTKQRIYFFVVSTCLAVQMLAKSLLDPPFDAVEMANL